MTLALSLAPHAIRDELTAMIVNDLLGPASGPEEEMNQDVADAYDWRDWTGSSGSLFGRGFHGTNQAELISPSQDGWFGCDGKEVLTVVMALSKLTQRIE